MRRDLLPVERFIVLAFSRGILIELDYAMSVPAAFPTRVIKGRYKVRLIGSAVIVHGGATNGPAAFTRFRHEY